MFERLGVMVYLDDLASMAMLAPERSLRLLYADFYGWKSVSVLRVLNLIGSAKMARGKGATKNGTGTAKQQWTTFVDVPVSGDDWPLVLKEYGDYESLNEALAGLVGNGYRVSFSYNPANDAIICSVTCKDEESVNNGMTMTSFAGTWPEALMVAAYKHYVVTKQNWAKAASASGGPRFG